MDLTEWIRVAVLGNPIKSPDNITATSLFVDQLFYNLMFDLFVMVVIITLGAMAVILVMRKRRGSREFLVYVTGAFIIFSALEYQYVSRILGSDATLHNVKVAKNIEDALGRSKAYLFDVVGALFSPKDQLEAKQRLYQDKKTRVQKEEHHVGDDDREHGRAVIDKTGGENAGSGGLKRPDPPENSRKHPPVRKGQRPIGKSREANVPKAASAEVKHTKHVQRSQDAGLGRGSRLPNTQESKDVGVDSFVGVPKARVRSNKEERTAGASSSEKQRSDISLVEAPSEQGATGGGEEDGYMKSILYIFENEFVLNNKIAAYFEEISSMRTSIHSELNRFRDMFQAFYSTSMKMEGEMSSFNANPKYFQYEVDELVNSAKEVLSLANVLDNLNYKNGTDARLNEIFKVANGKPRKSFKRIEGLRSQFWLNAIRLSAALQAAAGIWLLVILFCEIDFVSPFVAVICMLLGLNVLLSVYAMLLAQSVDKICILGNVDGCRRNFTPSFTKFAATTNIDLNHRDRSLKVDSALNQIEQRTRGVVNILKQYLENSPGSKFAYKSLVIQNFFDKIAFVKEDFGKLTNNKTNKETFYQSLDSMCQVLYQIKSVFENIQSEKIVDFYTREVIFYNFIRTQRPKIVQHVYDQISQSTAKLNGDQQASCNAKKMRVCSIRIMVDKLFLFLLLGSTALCALYLF